MDDADRASEVEDRTLRSALQARHAVLSPCGYCFYCDAPVRAGVLFCEAACRDDWQREDRIRRISGKA